MSLDKPKAYTSEETLEELLYFAGIIILIFGFFGILLIILYTDVYKDDIHSVGMTFLNSYMIAFGIFLVFYHDKIIVKAKPT
ncbi:hypothetical protein A3K64_03565 [Candidatus Micrarchaeota archaeon RBG_16_36_9]|nr:MAG: hypothetical protein A3K64_03565 [Candidatus Micrarchaeota archaeon RBG_16_36_9]